jgi:hypothetical protein
LIGLNIGKILLAWGMEDGVWKEETKFLEATRYLTLPGHLKSQTLMGGRKKLQNSLLVSTTMAICGYISQSGSREE